MQKVLTKTCTKHGETEFVLGSGEGNYRCKQCRIDAVNKRRAKLKQLAVDYKGGKCEQCGYDKCIAALEFHHLDPLIKEFSISSDGYGKSWEKIKIELDKCDLLCSNCHREKHFEQDYFNQIQKEINLKERKCQLCNATIDSLAKSNKVFCSKKCRQKSSDIKRKKDHD